MYKVIYEYEDGTEEEFTFSSLEDLDREIEWAKREYSSLDCPFTFWRVVHA